MPVYNEARTLRAAVSRVLASPVSIPMELICVDDASTDGSRQILEELAKMDARIKLAFHEKNRGKGAAIQTAIARMSTGPDGDGRGTIAIIQDADLEYDPRDYPAAHRARSWKAMRMRSSVRGFCGGRPAQGAALLAYSGESRSHLAGQCV